MSSIVIVLFSKDRPLQLDATLGTLAMHGPERLDPPPVVLYTTSGPRFDAAYGALRLLHPSVEFRRESNFKIDLLEVIGGADQVLFLVDDTVITAGLPLAQASHHLDAYEELAGFSFRLGRNTEFCYPANEAQALPEFSQLDPGALSFDWRDGEHDFGYPLEVSASLYRAADIRPLLGWLEYRNPNTLETELAAAIDTLRSRRPRLGCLEQSVAVSVPANVVQAEWSNRVGSDEELGAMQLLSRFERGERLDIACYRGIVSSAPHQELGFVFARDADMPTVSVVLGCRSHALPLSPAVQGLVGQTFVDWELVLVDDGCPGTLKEVLRGIIDAHPGRRVRVASDSDTAGSRTFDCGIEASLGRYVVLLEAHEALPPTLLERFVDFLEGNPGFGFVRTDTAHGRASQPAAGVGLLNSLPPAAEGGRHGLAMFRRHVWYEVSDGDRGSRSRQRNDGFWSACIGSGINGMNLTT